MSISECDDVVTFRLDEEQKSKIEDIAWEERTTKSHIFRALSSEFLEDEDLQGRVISQIQEETPDE